ncbi:VaFE repeat-containing surface-anchored protein [Corynebacterium sp. MSK204]|uniref:VaFE repeat-containing surface-anchored protein n=1 Tax=Corynebacterium sp. MSK204 TaxID=3050217 RepID=UPI00254E360B|nr:VaFE repeat-containing surface-anchored protein [Corynebacterium sp. MSK204]
MPPDQPGLPDTEGDEPEESTTPEQPSEEETTEDEPTEEESTPNSTEEQPSDEETSTEETTSSEEPSTEQTTTQPSTEPSESTPTTSASEKKLQPKIRTKAEFADDADQVVAGAKVKDTVHYEDLVPNKKYTLEAELKDKAGDHQVVGKGKKTFTPEKSSGDVDVEITVDSGLKKPIDAAVAFETLTSTEVDAEGKSNSDSDKKNVIAEHKDLSDEAQTVNTTWNPEISTKAKLAKGESVESGAKVTDTVKYKDLVPGKQYTLNAELVNKADESVIGKGEKTFTPKKSAGNVDVEITVDSDVKNPVKAAVAFEELTSTEVDAEGEGTPDAEKPNKVAEHKDINDEDQTVNTKKDNQPSESSSSETSTTSSKPSASESKSSEPSTESSSESETSEPSDSETSTSKTTTSTEPSSTTSSEKPEEPADTSAKPEISTNADFAQGSHEVVAGAEIVDEVSYEGLVPGKEYTLQAELISKADKETVLGKGETTFTPEKSAGKVDVKITVDSDVTEPVEAAVAFEELTSTEVDAEGEDTPDAEKPNKVAEHKDINDEDQTVISEDSKKVLKPEISTNADFAQGSHEVVAGAEIVDEVSYEGLVPGKEYTLQAELISKADKETVLGKGETTFTPEKSAGKVDVKITVDSDVTEPVEAAVAFEELTSTEVDAEGEDTPDAEKPNKVAEHKDINDEDQTVTSDDSDVPGKPSKGKIPKWAILIPGIGLGIGLGKIIFGHHDHDHGHHDHDKPKDRPEKDTEGHGEHPSTEVKGQDTPDKVNQNSSEEPRPTEVKGQDTPDKVDQGTDKDDRPVEVMGQEPGKTGKPLPSDAGRTQIKSVPSGATKLDPGMRDYIQ